MLTGFKNAEKKRLEKRYHEMANTQNHAVLPGGDRDISLIELNMLPALVRNNRVRKLWPLSAFTNLYCLSLVIASREDRLSGWVGLESFTQVQSDEYLPLHMNLYRWEQGEQYREVPTRIYHMCMLISCRQKLLPAHGILNKLKNDPAYLEITDNLFSLEPGSANFCTITDMNLKIASLARNYMGKTDPEPLGTAVNSFVSDHGDMDKYGIIPINISTRHVDFNFELVLHNGPEMPGYKNSLILPDDEYHPRLGYMVPM